MAELQMGGLVFPSNAVIDGKFALRGCVLNYRTTRADMAIVLEDVRRAAHLATQPPPRSAFD